MSLHSSNLLYVNIPWKYSSQPSSVRNTTNSHVANLTTSESACELLRLVSNHAIKPPYTITNENLSGYSRFEWSRL
ncbi:MAG: hypothetical protein JKX76_03200 [Colwellia sp.]|nr:hypothetical protein [Colwellia sp.]